VANVVELRRLSTPNVPISSSSAWFVAAVAAVAGVALLPVPVAVRSRRPAPSTPENTLTLAARAVTEGCVMVIVLPDASAVVTADEKRTVRTPLPAEPFWMLTSCT